MTNLAVYMHYTTLPVEHSQKPNKNQILKFIVAFTMYTLFMANAGIYYD